MREQTFYEENYSILRNRTAAADDANGRETSSGTTGSGSPGLQRLPGRKFQADGFAAPVEGVPCCQTEAAGSEELG